MKLFQVSATLTTTDPRDNQAIAEELWRIVEAAIRSAGHTPGLVQAGSADLPETPDHSVTEVSHHG